ncbi:hypothetical protein GO986_01515 [Deinococcus sp. HMF7620]|uniref:Phosphoribosyl-ATP pyrophosphohydrolase n=1 Tax=Deinococcus arboris TaxID=2682977 RepID=A0A7C9LNS5_9DEIO|nr:nucleoside triphosphate pyrophosphohydrolase [Deinococcus arboris]MVN85441.1 hypothetical protein [Deinococcus arboris]
MPKLVRDRIPELSGGQATPLGDAAFRAALREKLQEEVAECLESGETEELADVLEVVLALAKLDGVDEAGLNTLRRQKAEARGAFTRRLWWTAI